MYKAALFLGFFLLLAPTAVLAATPVCSANGYTVVYVNGVFDTLAEAKANRDQFQRVFDLQNGGFINNQPVNFQLGYNPTHLAGAGDLAQSVAQLFNASISNFDLNTILMQIYPEVTTRKLLLVGHSQGSFYTNSMYSYLLSHGEPGTSVAVYNVASPAAYTAGNGKYINSSGDTVLADLRIAHLDVLPNTIDLVPTESSGFTRGHSFVDDYLALAASQMLGDISGEMQNLQPTDASETGDCFTPPTDTLGYKTEAAAFAVADPTATVLKAGGVATMQAGAVALNVAAKVAVGALQLFADSIRITTKPPSPAQTNTKTLQIVNKLYGSSVENLSPEDKKELLGAGQGAAVALASAPVQAPASLVLGTSTVVDAAVTTVASTTLLEQKNIFPVSSNGIVWGGGAGGPVVAAADESEPVTNDPAPVTIDPIAETPPAVTVAPDTTDTTDATTTDAAPQVTDTPTINLDNPSVVINEIQWAGDLFDGGREWIELKNRTANDIDLSKYVIYAADGGSQYIQLSGTLPGNTSSQPFFIVQRDSRAPFGGAFAQLQIMPFDQLADSGEQLALARVDDTGTTTIDMTPALSACNGWCAGSGVSSDNQSETLSMERISADALGTDPGNWASNDTYTVTASMPTPIGQPWLANGLPLYATPLIENSLHLPATGFYCNPDKYPLTPGGSYHPQTGQCTVLDRDIAFPGPLSAGVFKGVVGSSTQVGSLPGVFHSGKMGTMNVDFSDAQDGGHYFVAIWRPFIDASLGGVGHCTNPNDDVRLPSYFTIGHWLARDGWCGDFTVDMTDAPDTPYVLIPFTYRQ